MKRLLLAPLLFLLVSCSTNNVNQSKASNSLTSSFSEKIDDFDNSTTWQLRLWSKNKLPSDVVKEGQALISVSCTKYAQPKNYSSGYYVFSLIPPSNLKTSYVANYADMKWDENQPELKEFSSDFSGSFANFSYAGDLIKKLGEHSSLKIRYSTLSKGEQIAEFSLYGENNISKLLEKCKLLKKED